MNLNILEKIIDFNNSIKSATHILYRLIPPKVKNVKPFICVHPDDYGLQLMKTQNSVSQNIRVLQKTI